METVPALRRARNPPPGNSVLLRNSVAPENGCRGKGCRSDAAYRSRDSSAPENPNSCIFIEKVHTTNKYGRYTDPILNSKVE